MSIKSKGQAWVGVVVSGVIGIVIAANILFSQIGSIKASMGVYNSTGQYVNGSLSASEYSIASLIPFVLIAGFVLLALGIFLYNRK